MYKLLLLLPMLTTAFAGDLVPFAGTWEGKLYELPAVGLTLHSEGTAVTGTITFYFLNRENEKAPWKIAGKTTLPLLKTKVEGGKLSFEVRHAKQHGSSEMGPNVHFRVERRGEKDLALFRLDDGAATQAAGGGMPLIRRY